MSMSQDQSPADVKRRSFLTMATIGLNGAIGFVLGIPALFYSLLDPANRPKPPSGFRRVAKLSQLEKGVPFQAVVKDQRHDAWTYYPNDVIGRVWLIKQDDESVSAYTTICSHLGCSINFVDDQSQFVCPCHKGTWETTGEVVSGPVPRGMDALAVNLVKAGADDAHIEVKYQNFRQGETEAIPKD